jgi:nucleotide-binding universal stress UspA family protein
MTLTPEQQQQPPTVVVAVEETAASRAALRLAAQEAGYREAPLIAVMAYGSNSALGAPAGRPLSSVHTAGDEQFAAESALRDAVVDALGEQAGQVELRTMLGQAGRNLVEVARKANAQLLVLAGRSGTATLLGGVSQHVLRKAPCPVLIVPETGIGMSGATADR